MKVVLISTYELGRQPFGLASPASWLKARGHEVRCADLGAGPFPKSAAGEAGLVAFYLPMHTATRMAAAVIQRVREMNPSAHLAAYGLYAPINEKFLRSAGVRTIIGGEFEAALSELADSLAAGQGGSATLVPLDRLQFLTPDRAELPELSRYAKLCVGSEERIVGYTEASRGCKHLCRHCPVVPVYRGAFRVVQPEVVRDDIRQQVTAGAQHITFGDPDFLNGPRHAQQVVEALHREFPELTYDVTIKVEHLLTHRDMLPLLRETGCLFVTSAVESVEDAVLEKLQKHHTRRDFVEALELCRGVGLPLAPTFIAFTPWATRQGYAELLATIRELDLVDEVSSVQLGLRLLIPNGSRLLELEEIRSMISGFDPTTLVWKWSHSDPSMDQMAREALLRIDRAQKAGRSRRQIFAELVELATGRPAPDESMLTPRAAIPYLNEPWYC